jgi:hypothetical protein
MPRVVFEPSFPFLERAKTVHALDRAATVIGFLSNCKRFIFYNSVIQKYEYYKLCRQKCSSVDSNLVVRFENLTEMEKQGQV